MSVLTRIKPEDILIFVHQVKEARYNDLIKEFVVTRKCAKQTLLNYKRRCEAEGKLDKKISQKGESKGRPIYFIPERFKPEIQLLIDKRRIKKEIDRLNSKEIAKLLAQQERMLEATFNVLIQRKVTEALQQGREYVTGEEINQVFKDVAKELKRPKVGNLFKPQKPYKSREERLRKQKQNRTKL